MDLLVCCQLDLRMVLYLVIVVEVDHHMESLPESFVVVGHVALMISMSSLSHCWVLILRIRRHMEPWLEIHCELRLMALKVSALVVQCEILILNVHLHVDLELVHEMRLKVLRILVLDIEFHEILIYPSCSCHPQ